LTTFEKKSFNGQELAKFLKEKLESLFMEYDIDLAFLGGSWSTDSNSWWSDIDIFISAPNFLELSEKSQLDYSTKLSVKASKRTDLEEIEISILEKLPLHVQFSPIHDGILIYEKNSGLKAKYVEDLLPRYYDHMIWYKRVLKDSNYVSSTEKHK